jgi:hypothetical protein
LIAAQKEKAATAQGEQNVAQPLKKIFLGQLLYLSFSTHKQCKLSLLNTTALLCFP